MNIEFTRHAKEKLKLLKGLGVEITEAQVVDTVQNPDKIEQGRRGEWIAQKRLSERHVLRVPYVQEEKVIRIITMYPGRRERYETESDESSL